MQRAARFLLWGGLALLILSLGSCGAACAASVGTAAGEKTAALALGGAALTSILSLALGLAMVFCGAILKAVSKVSGED